MNSAVLSGQRKVYPRQSIAAVCKDYKLTFNLVGLPYIEPSFANLVKIHTPIDGFTHDRAAEGVAHLITEEEYMQVRRTEGGFGSEYGYQDVPLVLTTCEGHEIDARSLISAPSRPGQSETRPSLRYLTLIRDGAGEHVLSTDYMKYLNHLPHYTPETRTLTLARLSVIASISPFLIPSIPALLMYTILKWRPPTISVFLVYFGKSISWHLHDKILVRIFGQGG